MSAETRVSIDRGFFAENPAANALVSLYDFLPNAIFYAKDRHSRFVASNAAMLKAKNLSSPEDLLGKTDHDFHPPALADAYVAEDRRVMKDRVPLPNQVWFVLDRSGRPGWFNSSKVPIPDANGRSIGIAGVRYAIDAPEEFEDRFESLAHALRHLELHYTESVSMKEVAELAGLSTTHFNRKFSELLGMSPTSFLHSLRTEKTRQLLASSNLSIGEIAVETGYFDQSHFTRRFRSQMGMTPRAYRVQFR